MSNPEECLLKAETYISAAKLVAPEDARALIRLAAIWRNRAMRARFENRGLRRV